LYPAPGFAPLCERKPLTARGPEAFDVSLGLIDTSL
jgi:hypothetical protein